MLEVIVGHVSRNDHVWGFLPVFTSHIGNPLHTRSVYIVHGNIDQTLVNSLHRLLNV